MKLRLRDVREDNEYKQEYIAKVLGISRQYYSRYELGKVEMPIRHYVTLAKLYNVSIDYLCGEVKEIKPFREQTTKEKINTLSSEELKLLQNYKKNKEMKIAVNKLLDIK